MTRTHTPQASLDGDSRLAAEMFQAAIHGDNASIARLYVFVALSVGPRFGSRGVMEKHASNNPREV
jgi:hypothetical protein